MISIFPCLSVALSAEESSNNVIASSNSVLLIHNDDFDALSLDASDELMRLLSMSNSVKGYTLPEGFYASKTYPFIIIVNGTTPLENLDMTDDLFNELATGIQFKVNKTDLLPESEFFKIFENTIAPLLRDDNYVIQQMFIRGAASPEGPYLNNQRLGKGRTEALLNYIKKATASTKPSDSVETFTSSVTEDYARLVDLMEDASDKDTERVRALFESCSWDEKQCKELLGKEDNGVLWNRLLKEYFPALRSARVVFVFRQAGLSMGLEKIDLPAGVYAVQQSEPVKIKVPEVTPVVNGLPSFERRHLLAFRTNLVRDLFYMPRFGFAPSVDAQLEYYPLSGHYTANASFTWSNHRHWDDHKFFQVRDAQLELRRYFKGDGSFTGLYLGLYGEGVVYGIGLGPDTGWEGEGWGAGLDLGYVIPLNRKGNLRLEFNISGGYLGSVYDPYVFGNPVTGSTEDGLYYYNYLGSSKNFIKRNHLLTWFGPTNVGINLTYDILYRKRTPARKGGAK
ncbi:MAG: DUF3575 domain-containing protein [Bacteroidales bacterium]|nr:DUF3575 domain-containing protein [Bacteroidales bacterium]